MDFTNIKALNIGSNKYLIEGFINGDVDTSCNPNVVHLNAEEHFNYEDNYFDYIYSCHVIEHLSYNGFKNYLSETYRCLKRSGIHRFCFPSLDQIKKMLINPHQYKKYFEKVLSSFNSYSMNDFDLNNYIPYDICINNLYKFWGHQNIYTEQTIIKLCENTNYKDIKLCKVNVSDHEIFKNIEIIPNTYDFVNFKKYESSVIECTK